MSKDGVNAGMVLRTPSSSEEKAGLEYRALEEGNEQKVSDTPCLSVIAGLIHTGVDSLPSIHSPEGPG